MKINSKRFRIPRFYHILLLAVLLVLPAQAAPITPADLALAPQAPPIYINVNLFVENLFIGETAPPPPDPPAPAVETTNCEELMNAINAAAGQADPQEFAGSVYQQLDGCALGVIAR